MKWKPDIRSMIFCQRRTKMAARAKDCESWCFMRRSICGQLALEVLVESDGVGQWDVVLAAWIS